MYSVALTVNSTLLRPNAESIDGFVDDENTDIPLDVSHRHHEPIPRDLRVNMNGDGVEAYDLTVGVVGRRVVELELLFPISRYMYKFNMLRLYMCYTLYSLQFPRVTHPVGTTYFPISWTRTMSVYHLLAFLSAIF